MSRTCISAVLRSSLLALVLLVAGSRRPENLTPAHRLVCAVTAFTGDRLDRALDPQRSNADLNRVAAEVLQQCRRRQTDAQTSYTCGIAAVIVGSPGEAVDHLRNATDLAPRAPGYWSDLAVALQELAHDRDDPQHLVEALVACDTALRLRSGFAPALLARASTLEAMGMNVPALDAYGACLRAGVNDPWSSAALARAGALRKATHASGWQQVMMSIASSTDEDLATVARDHPNESLAYAEDVLLPRWANLELSRDTEKAEGPLALARRLGRALHENTGASSLAETVAYVDRATGADRNALALGHRLFGEARDAYRRGDINDAKTKFARAGKHFDGKSLMMWVKSGHLYNNCLNKPKVIVVPMYMKAGGRGFDEASLHDLDALATFEHSSHAPAPILDRTNAADAYARLGHRPEAWRERIAIFRSASKTGNSEELQVAIFAAAESEASDERWASAHALLNVAAGRKVAASRGRAAQTFLWRAVANERLGWHDLAANDLNEARAVLESIVEPRAAAKVRFQLLFAEGVVARGRNPSAAIQLLNEFIKTAPANERHFLQHEALLERARAKRATHDDTGAVADLESALEAIHPLREYAANYRSAYGAAAEAIVDELVDTLGPTSDPSCTIAAVAALNQKYERVSERRPKARPPGVTVVRYVALPRRMIVIVSSQEKARVVYLQVSSKALKRAMGELDHCIRAGKDSCETWTRRLGAWLLGPLQELGSSSTVEIIADRSLAHIPFSILRRSATNRPLIEEAVVIASESDTDKSTTRLRDQYAPSKPLHQVASVGDPAFGQRTFSSLGRLPNAKREAAAVIRVYADGVLLTDVAATPERVRQALVNARIANIAAHAVVTPGEPSRSCLLAPSPSNSGRLYLHEIESMDLRNLDVLILTGCHTADPVEGEGNTSSLASAFLAAGAKNVVGSLWDVDDEVGRFISARLHRELLKGTTPAEALRRVQLSMINSSEERLRRLSSWGGLRIHVPGR